MSIVIALLFGLCLLSLKYPIDACVVFFSIPRKEKNVSKTGRTSDFHRIVLIPRIQKKHGGREGDAIYFSGVDFPSPVGLLLLSSINSRILQLAMGLLALHRRISLQRRRQILGQNASAKKRKSSPCQHDSDGDSQAKIMRCSIPDLPEDIWWHIHSLMSLHDAARAACVFRAFLRSWRCYPDLILDNYTLAWEMRASGMSYSDKIDRILRNHSGCFKSLTLDLDLLSISRRHLNSWLRLAVKPGIEDLTLLLPFKCKYNVPRSLLSDGVRNSIRHLEIGFCNFRPTTELGPLRNLTSLDLVDVRIKGEELECLLSNALTLEQLALADCKEITHLKILCALQQARFGHYRMAEAAGYREQGSKCL
ncbi:hypothetical protein BS78_07G010700 [Paspalum vaginatum]|nr:hypothetical protein BS78_07G010700 [Paspalum vaginatum]